MLETVWQIIYKKLKEKNIDVYSVGQHQGECKNKYVVVKDDGVNETLTVSSNIKTYTILIYVPLNNFSELEIFVEEIKGIMKELFPMVRPNGIETPAIIEDSIKAHMVSVQYSNYRKVNYW